MTHPTSHAAPAGIDLDDLTRYDHRGALMVPDEAGDYFNVADVRALAQQAAVCQPPAPMCQPAGAMCQPAAQAVDAAKSLRNQMAYIAAYDPDELDGGDSNEGMRAAGRLRSIIVRARDAIAAHPAPVAAHADDDAVDRFAAAMKEKMARSRAKGRNGWDNPDLCSAEQLNTMLVEHLAKGDPLDVGNFAMMLWNRRESTTASVVAPRGNCIKCLGTGWRRPDAQCPSCDGTGHLNVAISTSGSKDARRYRWLVKQIPCNIADALQCGIPCIAETIDAAIAASQKVGE